MADNKTILEQLGLSKSQIKQLPKSIRDEADMIDGTREIVGKMPEGEPRSIMNSSVGEAIEIFKNQLLEQEEVELTELQKKQIQEHKPKEAKDEKPGEEDAPQGDDKPSGEDQPGAEDTPEGDDRPAADDEPKAGGDDGDTGGGDDGGGGGDGGDTGGGEDGGGRDGDGEEPKDLGGEDIPRVSGGGGGGGVPPPPLDIPEDAYPIPRIGKAAEKMLDGWSFVDFTHGMSLKEPKWKPTGIGVPDLFFMWSVEQWVIAWNAMLITEWSPQPATLHNINLFSLMQYKWERMKGKQTKALDRYYIYSQYTDFLLFFLNCEKERTIGEEALRFMTPDGSYIKSEFAPEWENGELPRRLFPNSLVRPFENYLPYMQKAGYYPGEQPSDIDKTLTRFLPRAEAILDPLMPAIFAESYEQKIERLFELNKYTRWAGGGMYYTNGFMEGVGVTVVPIKNSKYIRYVEMVKYNNLALAENRGRLSGGVKDVYKLKFEEGKGKKLYALHEYSSIKGLKDDFLGLDTNESTLYTRELENPYDAYLLTRKMWYSSMFFNSNDSGFAPPYTVNMFSYNCEVREIESALSVYLKFNRSINGLSWKMLVTNGKTNPSVYFHAKTADGSFNPNPSSAAWDDHSYSNAYSIAWYEKGPTGQYSINITLPGLSEVAKSSEPIRMKPAEEPPAAPTTPPRKKRPSRARKQKSEEYKAVEAEIKSLKSALKYLPKEEQDEIRQEIEALTQSLKHI